MRMHPLKIFLESNNLSIRKFLEKYNLKLSPTFISDVINGNRNLSKQSVEILSKATGISKQDLMFPELVK